MFAFRLAVLVFFVPIRPRIWIFVTTSTFLYIQIFKKQAQFTTTTQNHFILLSCRLKRQKSASITDISYLVFRSLSLLLHKSQRGKKLDLSVLASLVFTLLDLHACKNRMSVNLQAHKWRYFSSHTTRHLLLVQVNSKLATLLLPPAALTDQTVNSA